MKTLIYLSIATLLCSCATLKNNCDEYTILKYKDFGPQAMANELIGLQWWQWQDYGSDNPAVTYDINILVYSGDLTEQIKQDHPVLPAKNQDYRYISYSNAIEYFDKNIEQNVIPSITTALKETKQKLENEVRCKNAQH